jgi:hypothetical protein
MPGWSKDELSRIGAAEEVRIAARRHDGTLRHPVIVWIVRSGDHLYVRSAVKGPDAAWFRGVKETGEGRLWVDGMEKDVTFARAHHDDNDGVDAAYRTKYRRFADIVRGVVSPAVRSTTLRVSPRI